MRMEVKGLHVFHFDVQPIALLFGLWKFKVLKKGLELWKGE